MPHDPELVAETRAWLLRADRDLAGGRAVLAAQPPLTGDAVFHAQQAAEKAMKGFLTWHSKIFRKTHNLIELGEACSRLDPSLQAILESAGALTDYSWRFRYPGEESEPGMRETEEALSLALRVFEAVLSRLPPEVRP